MMEDFSSRSVSLLGKAKYANLEKSVVLIVGLGGVGGTAASSLLRSGVKNFILIDFDNVSSSNLNRQILYTSEDLNKAKVEVAKSKMLSINPNANIKIYKAMFQKEMYTELDKYHIDYIVDAIDMMTAKVELIQYALMRNIEFIVSLGMANRLDPSQVAIMRLDKTYNDPLAKRLRAALRKENVDLKKVMCVFSKEEPLVKNEVPASMIMVPSSAGLNIAYYLIKQMIGE